MTACDGQSASTAHSYAWDADSTLTSATDPDERVTQYGYDAAGRQTTQTAPTGGASSRAYDEGGRVTSATDPLGQITRYAYDERGDITGIDKAGTTVGYGSGALEITTAERVDRLNRRRPFQYCDGLTPVEAEASPHGDFSEFLQTGFGAAEASGVVAGVEYPGSAGKHRPGIGGRIKQIGSQVPGVAIVARLTLPVAIVATVVDHVSHQASTPAQMYTNGCYGQCCTFSPYYGIPA